MSDFAQIYHHENELLHRELYSLHRDIYFKALTRTRNALTALHAIEIKDIDQRSQVRAYITEFEALRNRLEEFGSQAAKLRTRLIHDNGCDASCEGEPKN